MITPSVNVDPVQARLNRLHGMLKDPTEGNRAGSVALYGWTIRNFDAEGGLIGGWTPLKPKTVKRKEKIGKTKMLVISGTLRSSIRPFYDERDMGVGSELTYSIFHQQGTDRIPARPYLPDRDTALGIGVQALDFFVQKAVRS